MPKKNYRSALERKPWLRAPAFAPPKRKRGGQPGNRNAKTHGNETARARDLRRIFYRHGRRIYAAIAAAKVHIQDRRTRECRKIEDWEIEIEWADLSPAESRLLEQIGKFDR